MAGALPRPFVLCAGPPRDDQAPYVARARACRLRADRIRPGLAAAILRSLAAATLACLAEPRSCRAARCLRGFSAAWASRVVSPPRRETYSLPSVGPTCGGS